MQRISLSWSRAAACILAAAFAFYVWRAATLSITTDEAFTYNSFVTPPWLQILTTYDANHHILHSYLCKLVTSILGVTELTLRLPALFGAALYLWSAWRLTRSLCGDSPVMPALCALLAFHPGVVDYFSLARGYSLGLGLMLYALAESNEERWSRASLALGLAVAANGVFVLPAAAWIIATLITRRLWAEADSLIVPGAAAALILMAVPVSHATTANFYFGASTILNSAETVFLYPLTLALVFAAAAFERGRLTLTLALILTGLTALHLMNGMPWPEGRTGCYLVPISILLVGHACSGWRWTALPLAAGAVFFLATTTLTSVNEWRFAANSREVFAYLAANHPNAEVAAEEPLAPCLEFYRRTRGLTAMPPVMALKPGRTAGVYVLMTPRPQLHAIARFQPSGVEIAVPENSVHAR